MRRWIFRHVADLESVITGKLTVMRQFCTVVGGGRTKGRSDIGAPTGACGSIKFVPDRRRQSPAGDAGAMSATGLSESAAFIGDNRGSHTHEMPRKPVLYLELYSEANAANVFGSGAIRLSPAALPKNNFSACAIPGRVIPLVRAGGLISYWGGTRRCL
jgi:hypothetical protein